MLHWQTVIGVGTKDLRGLVHDRWMRHGGHLEATHMVIHGDVGAQDSLFFWGLDGPGLRLGLSLWTGAETWTGTGTRRGFCALVKTKRVAWSSSGSDYWKGRVFVCEIWCKQPRSWGCS